MADHSTVRRSSSSLRFVLAVAAAFAIASGAALAQGYAHFEARQTHPIELTPDGTRLLALNSPDGRVSVFDVSVATNTVPTLLLEIPVGIEPVSVRMRTNDEAWVVNEVSDTVSVISLSRGVVIDTIRVTDEPADVVFANGKAFVSCARNNLIRVFDATSRGPITTISLQGLYPRALVANAAGSRIYVAFLHSGNRTTVLPASAAPNQPAPTNPSLPAAPKTALIVPASDSRIKYTVLDNDVAEMDTTTHGVLRYFTNVGTNLFDVALRPGGAELWVPNTEARNLVRFEPVLRGRAVDNRVSRIAIASGAITSFDLNPGIDYNLLPNAGARATALAQPTAGVFNTAGTELWVAAFGTDRVAKLSASGAVQARVDVRTPPSDGSANDSRKMRGPRGLALDNARSRLYVLNKLSNTVSVISTTASTVLGEVRVGSYDPMPAAVKEGRGFLFDARLSGNGTFSCATCHIDSDRDGIAWDLGDPDGQMFTAIGFDAALHDPAPYERPMHPMKGPMVTQTLRGMKTGAPFHWRGDKPTLQDFNPTFDKLMGGGQLSSADMDAMVLYLGTLLHHPNPNLSYEAQLSTSLNGGNAVAGFQKFEKHDNHCVFCHGTSKGTDNNIDDRRLVGSSQPMKNPPLETTYQRIFLNGRTGATSVSGYGLNHDGVGFLLPIGHTYSLHILEGVDLADVTAYVLSFHTGTFPAVGLSRTVNSSTAGLAGSDLTVLEGQAALGRNALFAQGLIAGAMRSFHFNTVTRRYVSDAAGESPLTRAQLLALLGPEDSITFSGGIAGQDEKRRGGDRDGNGVLDKNEPHPALRISAINAGVRVAWPRTAPGWLMEMSLSLLSPWTRVTETPRELPAEFYHDLQTTEATSGFFRLRRTW
jgi:YVTN family beta-propeller protein